MFQKLFQKNTQNLETLLEQVKNDEKKDFSHMFLSYCQLAKAYFDKQDYERAMLYYQRADNLSLSIEDLNVADENIEECSNQIMKLEDENLLCEETIQKIEEACESLNYVQMTLWNLMTLCRMEKVFQLFENQKNCQILQKVPYITNLILKILTEDISQEEFDFGSHFINEIYDLTDSPILYCPSITSPLPHHKDPLQIVDLNGGDALTSLHIFLDHEFNNFVNKEISDEFATDFVIAGLGTLKSYYLRTQNNHIQTIPQIQKELRRIWKDYEMIVNEPELSDVISQMREYRQINIFE